MQCDPENQSEAMLAGKHQILSVSGNAVQVNHLGVLQASSGLVSWMQKLANRFF